MIAIPGIIAIAESLQRTRMRSKPNQIKITASDIYAGKFAYHGAIDIIAGS